MKRPSSVEQYLDLVDQAIFESEELRFSAEYDAEYMGGVMAFIGELESGVKAMRQSMQEGNYVFSDQDLPFMELVRHQNERLLPFKELLRIINETHRQGLAVGDED